MAVTLTSPNDGSANLSAAFTEYETIGQLVDFINSRQGYTANVISRPDRKSNSLDHIETSENVNIGGSARILTALLHEQSRFISGSGLAEVEIGSSIRKPLADMTSFAYLSGGDSTAPTPTHWIDAINMIYDKEVGGFFISLCTDLLTPTLHLADKLSFGNSPDGSNEKFGSSGVDVSKDISARLDDIKLVNSEFMALGMSPITTRRADRVSSKTYPGWMGWSNSQCD